MRFFIIAILAIAACDACGPKAPKPKAEYSSSQCPELDCNSAGQCECK